MSNENLKQRTKLFALNVLKFVEKLPRDRASDILGRQLLRSGTSVGANYRGACRAKSPADFISKLGTVEEEADESGFWMELLLESGKARAQEIKPLMQEAGELVAIMIASINTARKSMNAGRVSRSTTPHSALRTPH
jgi:four helix bundle protein